MSLSNLDFISPKITLHYKGRNSHISHLGGVLSLIFLILIILFFINFLYDVIEPQIKSLFIYDQKLEDIKYNQTIDYLGINHFIQIFSDSDNGWFGELDNQNIIIYGIKENSKNIYNKDYNETSIDFYNTEHWVYDKCKNVKEINKNLFSYISKIISNYTNSICLRFYYNPKDKKYYEIGLEGYIPPNLETNFINEKKYFYKIIIEKCFNNSIFNNKLHYSCNNENEIKKYLSLYNEIFIYFSNNQIIPDKLKNPFEKYIHSISSTIQKNSYFENNIFFSPIKLITDKRLFKSKEEDLAFILKNNYQNNIFINEKLTKIGIFNFYFTNNLIIYKRKFINILDCLSHFGGLGQLLFLIFQIFNYVNSRYIIIEDTKNLFRINTGIETNNIDGNEIFLDKMRHLNSQNYKIKIFNKNNNNVNNDDLNLKTTKNSPGKNKNKSKYLNIEHGFGLINKSSKKNLGILPIPINNSHRKKYTNNNYDTKRSQTKYTNPFKQMGKQFTLKNKRKSYMSQGFLIKRKQYGSFSKNHSINDIEVNNDINSNSNINLNDNNNSGILLLKEVKEKEFTKYDSKNNGDTKRMMKKKANLKRPLGTPIFEGVEGFQINKKLESKKGRHKSVNFGNQRDKFLLSSNLLGIKNMAFGKNSSEYINDSSKQVMISTKNPFQIRNSKFQVEKNKYDDIISRPSLVNYNDNLNTVIYNPNAETASFLKTIIQSKIKLIMPETKHDYNLKTFLNKKMKYNEFFKFFFICNKKPETNIYLISNFRNKLLSEEHLYKTHINLFLLEKIFQVEEPYKFDINELYNNL